ncbi:hypothetical protein [Aquirufa rosea]|uniref:Uncharacterized protein n=1 Tax=Aquirufa rosea TaxID=2509241 RepID=A0A4Q1BX84_9BACT|nr:hypothetical protein [Aquirufa rosea]RXK46773.1 hypothetical protein ESB04_11435 [Aquirufa rosea]
MKINILHFVILLSFTFSSNLTVFANQNLEKNKSASDSTKSALLKEVIIISKKISDFQTEKPSRKRHYSFLTKSPHQIGMIFDEKEIIGKKLNYISIYFDKKYTPNYIFQILLFAIGKDSLPSTLLNKGELVFSVNHEGWNKFTIQAKEICIPKDGVAVVVNFFNKSNVYTGETDRIAMGKYSTKRRFIFRPTSQNEWIIFDSFQEGLIGPMIRISVDDE